MSPAGFESNFFSQYWGLEQNGIYSVFLGNYLYYLSPPENF